MTVDPDIEALLTSEPLLAYLATCREGRPHVAPIWYRYADGVVEIAVQGAKLRNLRENPAVSLAIGKDEGGDPEWMVTLRGTAEVVEDPEATREANRRINEKYGAPTDAWPENTLVRVRVGSASHRTY